jgi:hypothetical protein
VASIYFGIKRFELTVKAIPRGSTWSKIFDPKIADIFLRLLKEGKI